MVYDNNHPTDLTQILFEEAPVAEIEMVPEFTSDINQEKEEVTKNLTNPEKVLNAVVENNYLTFPETVAEDCNDLETMYYSDISAISTIQPAHEQSFYATTEKPTDSGASRGKHRQHNFNLLKEETEVTSEVSEQVAANQSTDINEYDTDQYDVTEDDGQYPAHTYRNSIQEIGMETDNPSLSESPYKLNQEIDDSKDQNLNIDLDINRSENLAIKVDTKDKDSSLTKYPTPPLL